jgi:hypothetical protein
MGPIVLVLGLFSILFLWMWIDGKLMDRDDKKQRS